MIQKCLCFLFTTIYKKYLIRKGKKDKVIKVINWRTAIVEDHCGHRHVISPCFLWFN